MVSAELLRSLLQYDPETGLFTWIRVASPQSRVSVGDIAGCVDSRGYVVITIGGRQYRAHRLAWLWINGAWPSSEIDHIDVNPSNNRWANLRLASPSTNGANKRRSSNNKSGFKGVSFHARDRKWRSQICVAGHRIHLGDFATAEAAHAAYIAAANKHFHEFGRGV